MLFGWLPQARPRCGPRRRWKDVVRRDLKDIDVEESELYTEARRSGGGGGGGGGGGAGEHAVQARDGEP